MNSQPETNGPIRILVADDSLLIRTLLQETLLEAGFYVVLAKEGVEAWELLQIEPIHLVMADVNMPLLDGFELTRMIRGDEHLKEIPVILMTAMDIYEDRRLGLISGATTFFIKDERNLALLPDRIIQLLQGSSPGSH